MKPKLKIPQTPGQVSNQSTALYLNIMLYQPQYIFKIRGLLTFTNGSD